MITTEPKLVSLFGDKPMVRITFIIIIVAGVLLLGHLKKKQNQRSGGKKTRSDPATHS
ncbi:hypothetical protein D3C85_1724030 [compost metagenome]